jgi:hypothetical protein
LEGDAITDKAVTGERNTTTKNIQKGNNNELSLRNDDTIMNNNVQSEIHGEWMVVTRKKRNPPVKQIRGHVTKGQSTSQTHSKGKEVVDGSVKEGTSHFHMGLEHKPPRLWRKPKKRKNEISPSLEERRPILVSSPHKSSNVMPTTTLSRNNNEKIVKGFSTTPLDRTTTELTKSTPVLTLLRNGAASLRDPGQPRVTNNFDNVRIEEPISTQDKEDEMVPETQKPEDDFMGT